MSHLSFGMGGSNSTSTKLSKSIATAKLQLDDLLKGLKAGAGKGGAGGGSVLEDYTFEMALLAIETKATNESINTLKANMEKMGAMKIKGNFSAIAPTMSRSEDLSKNDKSLIDQLFGDDLAKSTANLQAKFEGLKSTIKPLITDLGKTLSEDVLVAMSYIDAAYNQSFAFLGDVISNGFASLFNKDIKFDFKKMLGNFLSGLGDMVMSMAIKMKAIAALKTKVELALATLGGGPLALGAAIGLFALGAAIKGGGMALSASSSNAMVSNNAGGGGGYNNSSPSFNGYQAQGMTIKIEGELKGKGTDLVGVFNNVTRMYGNNG